MAWISVMDAPTCKLPPRRAGPAGGVGVIYWGTVVEVVDVEGIVEVTVVVFGTLSTTGSR